MEQQVRVGVSASSYADRAALLGIGKAPPRGKNQALQNIQLNAVETDVSMSMAAGLRRQVALMWPARRSLPIPESEEVKV